MTSRFKKGYIFFLLAAIYALFVATTCIPSSDDIFFRIWEFSSLKDTFLLHPNNWGDYTFAVPHNGRYLGNILGLLLGKSYNSTAGSVLRILFLTSAFFTLFALLNKLLAKNRHRSVLLLVLLVLMPVNLYTQTLHWTAGFSNYSLPILGMLLLFYMLPIPSPSLLQKCLITLVAFSSQLFAEHVTVYIVLLLVFCLWYKKIHMPLTPFALVGAVTGAVVMFSNPGYHQISSDGYRTIGLETFVDTAKVLAYDVIIGNAILLCVIGLCFFLLARQQQVLKRHSLSLILYTVCVLYALLRTYRVTLAQEFYRKLDIPVALLLFFLFLYFTWHLAREYKGACFFHLASLMVINGMLLFLSPITARCTLISFILLLFYTFALAEDAHLFDTRVHATQQTLFTIVALCYASYLCFSYYQNFKVHMHWESYYSYRYEQHASSMFVPELPYPDLVYDGNGLVYFLYGIYYDHPNDIYMEMHDYSTWCNLIQ